MSSTSSPKKVVSEARKRQNRQAQKNYRERQNRRLRTLEAFVETCGVSPILQTEGNFVGSESLAPIVHHTPPTVLSGTGANSPDNSVSTSNPRSQYQSFVIESSSPSVFHSSAIASPASHETLDQLLRENDHLDDTTRGLISSGAITVQDILKLGLDTLSKSAPPREASSRRILFAAEMSPSQDKPNLRAETIWILENRKQEHAHSLPDVFRNCIHIKELSTIAAIRCNAEMIGVTFEQLSNDDAESPLYDPPSLHFVEEDAGSYPVRACKELQHQHISTDLRPTAAQIKHRHHPWIDTIPSPTFRQRLVECLASDPPMVDEGEFCDDMEKGGLICWGSTRTQSDNGLAGRSSGRGSGAPWDVRSWEAQPWFLRKWWIVLGGSNGELFQTSKWWNEMRGDSLRSVWQ